MLIFLIFKGEQSLALSENVIKEEFDSLIFIFHLVNC